MYSKMLPKVCVLYCNLYATRYASISKTVQRNFVLLQKSATIQNSCRRTFSSRVQENIWQRPPSGLRNIKKNEGIGPIGWCLLLIPVSTFCLGTWQVKRKKWKEELIEKLLMKTREPAVPLPASDDEVAKLDYRKVFVRGEFDHSGEMYLGPRSLLQDGQSAYHGKLVSTSANTSSGYLVVTPFILSDTKEKILVNRGWVPLKQKQPKTRPKGQVKGEVELEGVVRITEPRPPFTPLNKIDARVWFSRDVEGMAAMADCRPVFIDASFDSTVEGGPIGGQTRASLRNEHLSYIFTWYGLSAATAFLWYTKFIR